MVLNKMSSLPVQLGRNSFLIFANYLDSNNQNALCSKQMSCPRSGYRSVSELLQSWPIEALKRPDQNFRQCKKLARIMTEATADNEIGDLRAKLNGTKEQLLLRIARSHRR